MNNGNVVHVSSATVGVLVVVAMFALWAAGAAAIVTFVAGDEVTFSTAFGKVIAFLTVVTVVSVVTSVSRRR